MRRTWVTFTICRKKKILNLCSFVLWQWGQSSTHVGLNWRHWVSVGDGEGQDTARVRGLDHGWTCVCACACGWRGWHTRAAPLSADSENMFTWDKSTKTHPSTGSKYALRHCWHGVNNLTLTEVGEARGRMETETEREMDWTVIDIQFELLQIFPFSRKLSTLWSVRAAGQARVIFQSVVHTKGLIETANKLSPCSTSENKQRCISLWPCPDFRVLL